MQTSRSAHNLKCVILFQTALSLLKYLRLYAFSHKKDTKSSSGIEWFLTFCGIKIQIYHIAGLLNPSLFKHPHHLICQT